MLHLVGSFKNGSQAAGQNSLEFYDPTNNKWSQVSGNMKISDNGGCTVQVSPTDIVVISDYHNPGNLSIMYRINLADGLLQNLRSPILEVRNQIKLAFFNKVLRKQTARMKLFNSIEGASSFLLWIHQ